MLIAFAWIDTFDAKVCRWRMPFSLWIWYVKRLTGENGHKKDACYNEIELCVETLLTVVLLVNKIARVDGITWIGKRIFSLTSSKFDTLALVIKLIWQDSDICYLLTTANKMRQLMSRSIQRPLFVFGVGNAYNRVAYITLGSSHHFCFICSWLKKLGFAHFRKTHGRIWANQPIQAFLVRCQNPCLQRTNVRDVSP